MNLLSNALGIHEKALGLRSQRLELIAKNIANADTPNFKAKDLDFKAVLSDIHNGNVPMKATQQGHYPVGESIGAHGLKFRTPFNSSFDGNTVEMSVEQAQYGKAAADYQATLSFLESRISSARKALRGE